MNGVATTKIWIVRRGNGKAEVYPSPVVLASDETFAIRNLTTDEVEVEFPAEIVPTLSVKGTSGERKGRIDPGATAEYRVIGRGRRFFEYKVTLPKLDQYAEGGSKPGVIIDP